MAFAIASPPTISSCLAVSQVPRAVARWGARTDYGEPARIRCDAGTMTPEASLIVDEVATGRQFKANLVPQSNEPISIEHLPAGTYRAALQTKQRRLVSDVFLVSR
jgi:hypothetical protein